MFPRIGSPEPGVEHAVRKNEVGRRSSAQCAPDAEAVELPEALHDDGLVMRVPFPDPARETRRESIAAPARAKRVYWHRTIPHPGIRRRIQGNDLNVMATPHKNSARL